MTIFEKIHLLLAEKPKTIVFDGSQKITLQIAEFLKQYQKAKIPTIFLGDVRYELETICKHCKEIETFSVSKTKLPELLFSENIVCRKCQSIANKKQKEKYNEQMQEMEMQTDLFIDSYLNPAYSFNDDVPKKNYYNTVLNAMIGLNHNKIFNFAAKMPYYDFLKTPYWAAVRYKVMQRAGFKCSLCNENGKLAVHHRSYENRGYEIQNQKDLICLCNDCHEKFHDLN